MAVYIVAKWGSETERFCDILGVFTEKSNSIECALKECCRYGDAIAPEKKEKLINYLNKYCIIKPLDYIQIIKKKINEPNILFNYENDPGYYLVDEDRLCEIVKDSNYVYNSDEEISVYE
ncbi:Hypothetical protein KVN_LOCUS318 [uncultured virus]|nr:Hypothetical protein KVN_LOCUS318 [uncultured virus]